MLMSFREITGIRKIPELGVLGAIDLLSGAFTKMVTTAVLPAFSSGYFRVKSWLAGFACHIDLEWWFFFC